MSTYHLETDSGIYIIVAASLKDAYTRLQKRVGATKAFPCELIGFAVSSGKESVRQ